PVAPSSPAPPATPRTSAPESVRYSRPSRRPLGFHRSFVYRVIARSHTRCLAATSDFFRKSVGVTFKSPRVFDFCCCPNAKGGLCEFKGRSFNRTLIL